jgi:hypothetical protein
MSCMNCMCMKSKSKVGEKIVFMFTRHLSEHVHEINEAKFLAFGSLIMMKIMR